MISLPQFMHNICIFKLKHPPASVKKKPNPIINRDKAETLNDINALWDVLTTKMTTKITKI